MTLRLGRATLVACAALISLAPSASALTGGRALAPGETPGWVARIYTHGQPTCTGSLIGIRTVVTAAHCVTDPAGAPLTNRQVGVTLGAARDRPHPSLLRVSEIRVPTEFSPDRYGNDVAVLLLRENVVGSQPTAMTLPWRFDSASRVQVYGYGPSRLNPREAGQEPGRLRVGFTTLTPAATCLADAQIAPEWSASAMQCLGTPGDRVAPCPQDSGGPAVNGGGVTGVISFSPNSACEERITPVPSVLARLDCGPQRAFVNRTFSPQLNVLSSATVGPGLRLTGADGQEITQRTDRNYGRYWLTSFSLSRRDDDRISTLSIPQRAGAVPVLIRGRVEVRTGVNVVMPQGCPQLPAV